MPKLARALGSRSHSAEQAPFCVRSQGRAAAVLAGCAARQDWSTALPPRFSAMSTLPVDCGDGAPSVKLPLPPLTVIAETLLVHAVVAAPLLSRYAARTTAALGTAVQLSALLGTQALPLQYCVSTGMLSALFSEPNAFDKRSRPLRSSVEPSAKPEELTASASVARTERVCAGVSLALKL